MLELLKVIVQPVILERGEDGSVVAERLLDVKALYTSEQVEKYISEIREQIESANASKPEREE